MKIQTSSVSNSTQFKKTAYSSVPKQGSMMSSIFDCVSAASSSRTGVKNNSDNSVLKTQIGELDSQIQKFSGLSEKGPSFVQKMFKELVGKLKDKKSELQNTYANQLLNNSQSKSVNKLNQKA